MSTSHKSSMSQSLSTPHATQDPSSTLSTSFSDLSMTSSEGDSRTWSTMDFSTTASEPSPTSIWTPLSSASSSLTLMVNSSSASPLPATQISSSDSTTESTPVKFKMEHIVAFSIGSFVGLLALAGLFVCITLRRRRRQSGHQRLYSDPDEKHDDDFATPTSLNNKGHDFAAAVYGRDRGSLGERILPRRILDRSYFHARRSLSDGGNSSTTPLLPPLSQSDSRRSERESSVFGLDLSSIHESPMSQSRSFDEEVPGPSSPSESPRYSGILPPRPLPMPTNPRLLAPQRRSNSIQLRMQSKAPLISSSTTPLPLSSSLPTSNPSSSPSSTSASGSFPSSLSSPPSLHNTEPFFSPVPEKLPALRPQRRTAESIKPPSWSSSNTSLSSVTSFRPTPSVSFKDTQLTTSKKPKEFMKLKFRRNQQHARKRSGPSGSLPLTSESFRCAGEKAMNDEDRDFFAHEGVVAESSPSTYSQPLAPWTTEPGTLIDT